MPIRDLNESLVFVSSIDCYFVLGEAETQHRSGRGRLSAPYQVVQPHETTQLCHFCPSQKRHQDTHCYSGSGSASHSIWSVHLFDYFLIFHFKIRFKNNRARETKQSLFAISDVSPSFNEGR